MAAHDIAALSWHPAGNPLPIGQWRYETQRDPFWMIVGTDYRTPPLALHLENGQVVLCRALPEERRWRKHSGLGKPAEATGRVDLKLRDGRVLRGVIACGGWSWLRRFPSPVDTVAWRPVAC